MSKILGWLRRTITDHPYLTLLALLLITFVLGAGATRRVEPVEGASLAYLPPGSSIAAAASDLEEFFGDSGDVRVATLVFRGDALTPGGVSQMDALLDNILSDPGVAGLLAPADPIIAPSMLIEAVSGVDAASVTQAEIDSVQSVPEIGGVLSALSGTDTDGTPVTIATIRLRETGDERVVAAERTINDLAGAAEGPLQVSSVSPTVIEDEYREATESGLAPLFGLALLLIAGLILLFMRTFSDLLITLAGLIFAMVWIVGAEGWLGPRGLGLIGPPSSLTAMVPIIVISLTVDYAIQAVSHYREQRAAGKPVNRAVRTGLRNVSVPLALAAVTTVASFLSTLFSPIDVVGDFGVVAGMGVGLSLIVMLTLVPAGRTIIDRRREARGTLKPPRPVSEALPGIERAARALGAGVARRPTPYIAGVVLVTIALGFAATGLHSEFSIRDVLPRNGTVLADMETLEAAVGGSTEIASAIVKGEATETRTLLNVRDISDAFADEQRRPRAAAGPMEASYESMVRDWTDDSGQPGDKYDPELAALFHEASAGVQVDQVLMQEFLDKLGARDPGLARVLVNDPDGTDTMLLQFPVFTEDQAATAAIQEEIDAVWFGEDDDITAVSGSLVALTVTDQITERQTEAISTTIAVALGILIVFFWITLRRPVLGIIAVAPIVLVLIWVLGTMALLGIPYTLITSIVTALSIGIGVDYTIHMIHRYREEFSGLRNPERAATRTLATTGSALLGSALTTALGFGVLIASPTAGSQQFGITAAITIGYSLIVSILVVPPAMTVWGAYQNMQLRSTVQRMWDDLDVLADSIEVDDVQEQAAT